MSTNMGTIRDTEIEAIAWRRSKVLELTAKGHNQNDVSRILQIPRSTISRDVEYLRQESRQALQEYITKKLPDEVRKSFIAMDLILKEAWHTVDTTEDEKTRLNALALINQVMASRMQLLGDVNVVDRVINLVTDIKDKQKTEDTQSDTQQQEVKEESKTNEEEIDNTNESE
jgi:hypothetical protein